MAEAEFDAILERHAIHSQIEEYIDALNHRDWARFGNTLAEDLVWSITEPFSAEVKTRHGMLELVKNYQEKVYDFVFQMGHGVVVHDVQGNHACARHTMQELSSNFMMIGIYYDRLRKDPDGIWRFTHRIFMPTYAEEAHPRGSVHRKLPDPGFNW